ncbi:MFS transporter [uncultured Paludibaculum sp.]|uniref:MFS transporter n=1 Tax=uncultured Paludibaculum sp. TaxID=1765020 RepID=UPI002AAA73DE|nr:MFS transporter [uncultured Paludibaculum sp.]
MAFDESRAPHARYKWEVLAILWVAFFLNQADRQIFNVVLPLIRDDLKLTDADMGFIAMAFTVVFALLVPVAGYVGDTFSRKWICTFSVLFWSLATMVTGWSTGVVTLILFRSIAMGGGEALFAPANYAMLAGYHRETRSLALALQQTSVYIGVIASGYAAGYIGEHYGWTYAFYLFGGAGVLLGGVMAARLKDPPPEPDEQAAANQNSSLRETAGILLKNPTAILLTAAFAGLISFVIGYLTWMPTLLHEKFHLSLADAGFASMFYVHVPAFIGVVITGRFTDRCVARRTDARLLLQLGGMLGCAPFLWLMGRAGTLPGCYLALAGFGLFRGVYEANTYAALYDVVPVRFRASAAAMMITFGFLTGALSPFLLGYLKPTLGLSAGVSWLAAPALFAATAVFLAWRRSPWQTGQRP